MVACPSSAVQQCTFQMFELISINLPFQSIGYKVVWGLAQSHQTSLCSFGMLLIHEEFGKYAIRHCTQDCLS